MNETAIAFHEAGHAVMAVRQRMRLIEVSIVPDAERGSLGHSRRRSVFGRMTPDLGASAKTTRGVERSVSVLLAGDVALGIWNPTLHAKLHAARKSGDEHDIIAALSMLNNVSDSQEEALAWYRLLRIRNVQSLCDGFTWLAVETVAGELMKEKRLSGRAARRLILAADQIALTRDLKFARLEKARRYLLKEQ